ncbi:UPF0182 family membrane protein [Occallatibacter riparius]|uniref:UPF0182 protein MOP44_05420 n=1 Tax=Occallatibacter riparius TaxID=1002689 RepID=A0A9J7BRB9_9BACT|nr:UPF0182 family protein [Occallatibacter riparius]UWZ85379.1 UPF0182 family protein [Occallatibacter riparius]
MHDTVIYPTDSGHQNRRGVAWIVLAFVVVVLLFSFRTLVSYYVENLWFGSLGYASVFWTSLRLEWTAFAVFAIATFAVLYGWCRILLHATERDVLAAGTLRFGDRIIHLPLERVLGWGALVLSALISLGAGGGMMSDWPKFALYLHRPSIAGEFADPILGRPLDFYLFTLPIWELLAGWLLTLAILMCIATAFSAVLSGGSRISIRGFDTTRHLPWSVFSIPVAFLLLVIAARVYIGRIELLITDHTVFSGVTYTDAHVFLTGQLLVCVLLIIGAAIALLNLVTRPGLRWIALAPVPAIVCYFIVQIVGWYVASFIVKPNQLAREQQYIAHNIDFTRRAYALDRVTEHEFPAETELAAAEPDKNQDTLRNVRLWDWRALQDTLRQIQEIRTYYDFPDVDIDRYTLDGQTRQVLLAARELNVDKLPESSRNWINEKLTYTHGYGITMNPVNGFTPEGMPTLLLSNMPVERTGSAPAVTRPEIYFGQLTDLDVYVKTHHKEFNFPQGQTDSFSSYEGTGGIEMGGLLRRLLIAFDRGDLTKVPFSDDIDAGSRLLMRRNIRQRVHAIAPFLTFEADPYITIGDDGRLRWIIDAFTSADTYPYATHYELRDTSINYLRNSVKVVIDAYNGETTFYVFDPTDPIIAAWRGIFPALFKEASAMPQDLRRHIRYPELQLKLQAEVYGLYHMTDPVVFYNREDLWTVASETGTNGNNEQASLPMEPNFVLMKLPGHSDLEFIDILPFTPANRNNLIGWIAGRGDGDHYGTALAYNFPKTRLVDGPLQIEARIDQNAQLSGQLTLWNQQGSHVRRGTLLVIPCGKALLYAEPIYLQAQRSPMPELRLVVLALQDKLAYGTTYEAALQSLFAGAASSMTAEAAQQPSAQNPSGAPQAAPDTNALIQAAARDLNDYQRLTAEGKLSDAGKKLEDLKQKLDTLNARQK